MKPFHRLGQPLPQRIAIVRALRGLGDLLCTVPALRALRMALPEAHITLIGLPSAKDFVQRFHDYLDEWLPFPSYPGIPESPLCPEQIATFLAQVQANPFDLVLQMHGSGVVTNLFTMLLGAKHNAGFYLPENYCPDPDRFLPYPEYEPEVWRHLRLMDFLGIPLQGVELEFPLYKQDWQQFCAIEGTRLLQNRAYICIHPGAHDPQRRWSPSQFAQVADALASQGLQVVFTGSAGEAALTQEIVELMQADALNLAGQTTLGALAVLLHQARLLICNDTGVSHLADALRVPSVVIFSASAVSRWAPLNRQLHRVVGYPDPATARQVLQQAENLLQQSPLPVPWTEPLSSERGQRLCR